MHRVVPLLALLLFLVGIPCSEAQPTQYTARQWSTPQGVPHSQVNAVYEAADGYIWIETSYAFARFNGRTFQQADVPRSREYLQRNLVVDPVGNAWMHVPNEGVYMQAPGARIVRIPTLPKDPDLHLSLIQGELYAWTKSVMMRVDYRTHAIDTVFAFTPALDRNFFSRVTRDVQGRWYFTMYNSLIIADEGRTERIFLNTGDNENIPHDIFALPSGKVLLATTRGLQYLENRRAFPVEAPLPSGTTAHRIHLARDGHLYVSSSRGLFRYLNANLGVEPELLYEKEGVSILVQPNGQIWYGTLFEGLHLLTPRVFSRSEGITQRLGGEEGLLVDRDGNRWFIRSCTAISRVDGVTGQVRQFTSIPNHTMCRWGLYQDRDGRIWVGSWGNGPSLLDGQSFSSYRFPGEPVTLTFAEDQQGRLWAGSDRESIIEIDRATGRELRTLSPNAPSPDGVVRALYVARDGVLWVGTSNRIWTLSPDGSVRDFTSPGFSDGARYFREMEDGSLWAGLIYEGVARLLPSAPQPFRDRDGLGNNTVSFLFPYGNTLIIGTNAGVTQVSYPALNAFVEGRADRPFTRIFGVEDGMPMAETNGGFVNNYQLLADSTLLIASPLGAFRMHLSRLRPPRASTPLHIEHAYANTLAMEIGAENKLPRGLRRIRIAYIALTFNAEGRDQYETLLEGLDADWVPAGSQTEVIYQYLNPGTYRFRVRAYTADGGYAELETPLEFTIAPYFYESAWFWWTVILLLLSAGVATDRIRKRVISRRERELEGLVTRRTAELASRNQDLADAISAKDRMLSVASHDIRSPIAGIASMAELIVSSTSEQERIEFAEDIRVVSQRTLRLVEDILHMARLKEGGGHTLRREPVQVQPLLESIVMEHLFQAQQKDQTLTLNVHPEALNGKVAADEMLLRQVFANLISNAIKYSPAHSPIVVSLQREEGTLLVSVKDQGPGVAPYEMESIFEPFAKGSARPTGGEMSTGLGLSIVRDIVRAHDGEVWCTNTPGMGATFFVRIPQITP